MESFFSYLRKNGIYVKGIIDNSQDKQGSFWGESPMVSLSQIEYDGQNICITVADDMTSKIEKQIYGRYPETKVLTLRKIVNLLEGHHITIF